MNFPEIIFEDGHLLVIDKPAGLVVDRSGTSKSETLQDMLDEKYGPFDKSTEFGQRSGIVHRLDKDTSGVLLISKDEETFLDLKRQFQDRDVAKEYIALVYGEVSEAKFEINAPIGRSPTARIKMAIVKTGREASTYFENVKSIAKGDEKYTLLLAYPKTGRTHQIRVHLAALGHPVVGDDLYAQKSQTEKSEKEFKRMMLHAKGVEVLRNNTKQRFESNAYSDFEL